jgi:hypothetical protein
MRQGKASSFFLGMHLSSLNVQTQSHVNAVVFQKLKKIRCNYFLKFNDPPTTKIKLVVKLESSNCFYFKRIFFPSVVIRKTKPPIVFLPNAQYNASSKSKVKFISTYFALRQQTNVFHTIKTKGNDKNFIWRAVVVVCVFVVPSYFFGRNRDTSANFRLG